MRRQALVCLWVGYVWVSSTGCSHPECPDDEKKIGTVCVSLPQADSSVGTTSDGSVRDAAGGASTGDAREEDAKVNGEPSSAPLRDGSLVVPVHEQANDAGTATGDAVTPADAATPGPDASTPGQTQPPICVPSAELCDETDNDCDGQVDEDAQGAPTWFRDCDGDGFAASKSESVVACKAPAAAGTCLKWIDVAPEGNSNTDCDDHNPTYKPGAGYGLPVEPNSSSDLNCDGVSEPKQTLTSLDGKDILLCNFVASCECSRPRVRNGAVMQDWLNWESVGAGNTAFHPPIACSTGADDILFTYRYTQGPDRAYPNDPGCSPAITPAQEPQLVKANQLCR